jgi:FkbM family methyltransferase
MPGIYAMLKSAVSSVLNKLVTRERFNDSRAYEAYLFCFRRSAYLRRRAEKRFYTQIIGHSHDLIFDIGANAGSKARIFSKLAQRVVCVEPSPAAIETLRKRFFYNSKITVVPKGVGENDSPQIMHIFDDSGPYNSFSTKFVDEMRWAPANYRLPHKIAKQTMRIEMTTLDSLIREFGTPFYIKIDVEGYEAEVIRGLSNEVPLISFECNLPEFAEETEECIRRLLALAPEALFNYAIEEPPNLLESTEWMSGAKLIDIARYAGLGYMEIFCASNSRS